MSENREQEPQIGQHSLEHHRLSQTMAGLRNLRIARQHMPESAPPTPSYTPAAYTAPAPRPTQIAPIPTDNLSQIRRAIEGMDIKDVTIEPDKQDLAA